MADVTNLKFNKRSNVEQAILQVTNVENQNWENWFISKGKYENWQNCELCGVSNGQTILKLPIFLAKFGFYK